MIWFDLIWFDLIWFDKSFYSYLMYLEIDPNIWWQCSLDCFSDSSRTTWGQWRPYWWLYWWFWTRRFWRWWSWWYSTFSTWTWHLSSWTLRRRWKTCKKPFQLWFDPSSQTVDVVLNDVSDLSHSELYLLNSGLNINSFISENLFFTFWYKLTTITSSLSLRG